MTITSNMLTLLFPILNQWGYWVIFIAAMLESSPIFGLLVPGQLIVIIGGFLVRLGILDLGDTIIIVSLAAFLGDLIGYLLGRKYGYSFIKKYGKYFLLKKENFEKTKRLMHDHTGKTMVIGRFNSLTRALAPFVAGSSDVPVVRFLAYNLIGGISWAVSFVMIGYIFGKSYEVASRYIGRFVFAAVIMSIAFIYAYRFINKKKHIFTKYHLYALILNIFSLYIFTKMTEDVISREFIVKIDVWLNAKVISLWNPLLNKIMITVTNVASPAVLITLSSILLIILIYKKKWYYSLMLLFSMAGGLLFEELTKSIIHRARPENALIKVSGFSFPSGHATMAIIFFSILIYSFKDDIKSMILKDIFIIGNILLFLLVGLSRVYLNVHWLSDILAGFGLGLFWLTLLILTFKTIISSAKRTLGVIQKMLEKRIRKKI